MNIVYLHQYFATPGMSGGTRSYEMARRLVARGHRVDLITTDQRGSGGSEWRTTDEAGVRVHWYPIDYSHRMGFAERVRAFLKFAAVAGQRAATTGADVVFATSTPLTIALPAAFAARRLRVPMVFEVRDLWPELPIAVGMLKNPLLIAAARRLERFAYRRSSRIVALAPRMREEIARTGYPADRITVIPNGCDRGLFADPAGAAERSAAARAFRERNPWLGDRPLVIYTGTIGQVNDVEFVARLAAATRARDPEIRFLLLGHGRHEERVRALAREAGILDTTFFMRPPVPKRELPPILAAADLALSTCADIEVQWQGASQNKFFDALAAGLPVGLNYRGWLGELLESTGAGLVFDRHDAAGAADLLARSLRDRDWKDRARAASARLARERFDRDRLAEELERVLTDAITPRK